MTIYKLTVEAVRERFMEKPLYDKFDEYFAAYSYDHAHDHVRKRLEKAGWTVKKITGKQLFLQDIRDTCDHTTD